jgi:uncharacterized protein YjiS (DUF1127 family)
MLMKPHQFEFDAQANPEAWRAKAAARPGFFTRVVMKLEAYAEHKRQRQAIRALDDRLLKDIGVSRAEAERIAAEPFAWTPEPSRSRSRG